MPANTRTPTGTATATAIVAIDVFFNAGAAEANICLLGLWRK
jgi:hypothetical protein